MENSMGLLVPVTLITTCALVSCSVIANADRLGGAAKLMLAQIGHGQPRASDVSPSSQAEQAVQDRLSAFDIRNRKCETSYSTGNLPSTAAKPKIHGNRTWASFDSR
jgi:hypothetical protein